MDNRLKEIRKSKNLTLKELAERLNVSYSAIQKLDAGMVDIDTQWMRKLSAVLDVEPYQLLPLDMQPSEHEIPDIENIKIVIETVEEWLEKHKKVLQPQAKAELISSLLEIAASESEPDKKKAKLTEFTDFAIKYKYAG